MAQWVDVCALEAIADPGSRGFAVGEGDWPLQGFLVRRGGRVYAYENRCPHAGHPLNWVAHRFLDREGRRILCASHGAVFEPDSGLCVGGPCPGARLKSLPVRLGSSGQRVEVDVEGWRWE
jgi:nitrite reductase/ring-hydroxylating ferredoxin subunit